MIYKVKDFKTTELLTGWDEKIKEYKDALHFPVNAGQAIDDLEFLQDQMELHADQIYAERKIVRGMEQELTARIDAIERPGCVAGLVRAITKTPVPDTKPLRRDATELANYRETLNVQLDSTYSCKDRCDNVLSRYFKISDRQAS